MHRPVYAVFHQFSQEECGKELMVGNMKTVFVQAALYSSRRVLPLAVSDSPSRPWQSRSAGKMKAQTRCISPNQGNSDAAARTHTWTSWPRPVQAEKSSKTSPVWRGGTREMPTRGLEDRIARGEVSGNTAACTYRMHKPRPSRDDSV